MCIRDRSCLFLSRTSFLDFARLVRLALPLFKTGPFSLESGFFAWLTNGIRILGCILATLAAYSKQNARCFAF